MEVKEKQLKCKARPSPLFIQIHSVQFDYIRVCSCIHIHTCLIIMYSQDHTSIAILTHNVPPASTSQLPVSVYFSAFGSFCAQSCNSYREASLECPRCFSAMPVTCRSISQLDGALQVLLDRVRISALEAAKGGFNDFSRRPGEFAQQIELPEAIEDLETDVRLECGRCSVCTVVKDIEQLWAARHAGSTCIHRQRCLKGSTHLTTATNEPTWPHTFGASLCV